jgi:hypothetical protein
MDIECALIVLNAPKHVHFIWNKMLKFKNLTQFTIMICTSKTLIIFLNSTFKT